jgi:tetratricopeptide (TPR) repeat protein
LVPVDRALAWIEALDGAAETLLKIAFEWPRRATSLALLCAILLVGVGCLAGDPLADARELHEQGQYAETLEPLRAFVDEHPDSLEANYLLGNALMSTGQSSLAIWPLRRVVDSPEYAVDAGLKLTRAMMASRTPSDALSAIEPVLQREPENVRGLELRAQALLRAGRADDALDEIAHVIELDPDNLQILVPRVVALIGLERIDEAEAALETAKLTLETTERQVGESLRGRLCVANGLFAFEKGEPERAEPQYASCLELYPTNQLVVTQAVLFYDKIGQRERGTETLRLAFEESRSAYFRVALARRMGQLGDSEAEERLLREEAEERLTPSGWTTLADYYVQTEDYDAACEAFAKAIELDPNSPSMMRFAYADTLIQAERYDDAARVTATVEQEHLRALLEGRSQLARGDASSALQSFEAGIRLWPNNPGARFLAGQAAERLGDFDRAISEYRESLRAEAGATEAGLELARILEAKGDVRAAMTALRRYIMGNQRQAEAYLLWIRLSRVIGDVNSVDGALRRLSQLPDQAPVSAARRIELIAERSGPQAAIDGVDGSLVDLAHPSNAIVLRALLVQLAALDKHANARERIDKAVDAYPEEAVFHELQARALLAAGEPAAGARQAYERALELDPELASALMGLAELAAEEGNLDAAVALYDRASQADDGNPEAALEAISLLQSTQNTSELQLRLESLLESDPRNARAANELAKLLAKSEASLDEAAGYAQRAAFFRSVPEAHETLGSIQIRRGEPELAVDTLTTALELQPDSTSALYQLGLAHAALGDKERARTLFGQLIEAAAPESEQAQSQIARLGNSN